MNPAARVSARRLCFPGLNPQTPVLTAAPYCSWRTHPSLAS